MPKKTKSVGAAKTTPPTGSVDVQQMSPAKNDNVAAKPVHSGTKRPPGQALSPGNDMRDVKRSKQRSYLLELPGELRNRIYEQLFAGTTVVIKPVEMRKSLPEKQRRAWAALKANKCLLINNINSANGPRQVLHYRPQPGKKAYSRGAAKWKNSISGILMTCHMIHDEASTILYAQCKFVFADAKRTRAFIKVTPPRSLQHVTHLDVFVRGYGQPALDDNKEWVRRYRKCWKETFQAIADNMPNLSNVKLTFQVPSLSFSLNTATAEEDLSASVLMSVLPLSNLKKLEEVSLHTDTKDRRAAGNTLHGRMLFMPLFANAGNNSPCQNKIRRIIKYNKDLVVALHTGLENAVMLLLQGESPENAVKDAKDAILKFLQWWNDPVGNTFST